MPTSSFAINSDTVEDFKSEIYSFFDPNGFMGRHTDALPGEEGNPLTETGTAYIVLSEIQDIELSDVSKFSDAVKILQKEPGLYNKKINGDGVVAPDELTHDDIIGVVAASAKLQTKERFEIAAYGEKHGWVFSNTGKIYPTAIARPWHIAFYKIAADIEPDYFQKLSLVGSILFSSFFKMTDAGGKRLTWIMLESIKGKSVMVDLAALFWTWKINKYYKGGMADVLAAYYNNSNHPFVKALKCR